MRPYFVVPGSLLRAPLIALALVTGSWAVLLHQNHDLRAISVVLEDPNIDPLPRPTDGQGNPALHQDGLIVGMRCLGPSKYFMDRDRDESIRAFFWIYGCLAALFLAFILWHSRSIRQQTAKTRDRLDTSLL